MNKKVLNQIVLILVLICGLLLGMIESNEATDYNTNNIKVKYYSHIQDYGWEEEYSKSDGKESGTTGQNKKLESIKIKLENAPQNAKIEYQAHIENIGWQNWGTDNSQAGTTGKNLRMEAIRIRLVNLEDYTVRYRTHVQDIGWQDWVEDGEVAGTTGRCLKIEAIEIEIVPKEAKSNIKFNNEINNKTYYSEGIQEQGTYSTNLENSSLSMYIDGKDYTKNLTVKEITNTEEQIKIGNGLKSYNFNVNLTDLNNIEDGKHTLKLELTNKDKTVEIGKLEKTINIDKTTPHIIYSTHVENIGWQSEVQDGKTAGTTGRNLKLEAIKINTKNLPEGVNIQYQTHVQDIGWQNYVKNGAIAGTTGRNLKVEAIKIQLTGTNDYSVEYRAHVQDVGWQDWVKDGKQAGTTGRNLKLEAIEIRIVPKVPEATVNIETELKNKTFYSDGISVKGWYLANISNTKLNIKLDGENIDKYVKQTTREDVYKNNENFGGKANNPTPGFQITVPKEYINNLENGTHKLEVTIYKNDGTTVIKNEQYEIKLDKTSLHLKYSVHMQDIGWENNFFEGETAGNTDKATKIEALKIEEINFPKDISIQYQSHVQDIGWETTWKKSGEQSGTTGQNKKVEAVRIKLVGTEDYSIAYRAYVDGMGWQDWAYDGEYAGTVGENLKLKAIEIKIVPKQTETKINICLDKPTGTITNETNTISGWYLTNTENTSLKIYIDNSQITSTINRKARRDVLNRIKGYGGDLTNKTPGFSVDVNFANYSLGTHTIKIEVLDSNGTVLKKLEKTITVKDKIVVKTGTYGLSGLKSKGDSRGAELTYYQYGSGPNVFFATFCVHGFEDAWAKDGTELVLIANEFWNRLQSMHDENLAEKWTIFIIPEVNPDGRREGYTNNGPGRTTLYSKAPGNKGIDINRNWSTGFNVLTSDRNYTGTQPFQAYESMYLRDFLLSHKSASGQTVLVDLHGWTQQLIGDSDIRNYYRVQFPENIDTPTYGPGYMINWARTNLGANGRAAKAALIELPTYIRNSEDIKSHNITERYISATLSMLNGIV